MFNIQEITEKLNWLTTVKEQTQKEFKTWLVDKRIPLEDRWKVFQRQGSKHLDTTDSFDFFGIDLENIIRLDSTSRNSFFYYDDVLGSVEYILKFQNSVVNLTSIQKKLITKYYSIGDHNTLKAEEYNEIVIKTIQAYKEEILKSGYSGFNYDW
jgi:hypothetical protein